MVLCLKHYISFVIDRRFWCLLIVPDSLFRNLPAKNPDEEQKHKEQYEKMVKGAKQKGGRGILSG